jgi:hypothetical protein
MAIDYTRDLGAFVSDLVPMEGAYGPRAVIPPHLETWLYRSHPLPEGDPAARNVLDARTKKQGKTATAAGVILYHATRKKYAECVIAAADQDQAKDRVLRAAKFAVENGPLGRHAKVYRDVIELDNGSLIQALPMDWRGAAGGNYSCVVFDELHSYIYEGQRRLFDELIIPPTQPDGVRWVASYAGFLGESVLLWELWQKALAGVRDDGALPIYHTADASLLALIDTGPESWRMPWTSGEAGRRYIAETQVSERPNVFRRLWLNEWVENESQFVTKEQWVACYSPDVQRWHDGDTRRLTLGADASTSRDLTALVGVSWNESAKQTEAIYCRVWRPERGEYRGGKPTIDLQATIGDEVLRLHGLGVVDSVIFDPFQLHSIALAWEKAGIRVIELPQTNARIESDQSLYDAILSKSLVHCGDPELTEHITNAVAVETPRGFRLAKERTSRKIDAAVALSMAHHGAMGDVAGMSPLVARTIGDLEEEEERPRGHLILERDDSGGLWVRETREPMCTIKCVAPMSAPFPVIIGGRPCFPSPDQEFSAPLEEGRRLVRKYGAGCFQILDQREVSGVESLAL